MEMRGLQVGGIAHLHGMEDLCGFELVHEVESDWEMIGKGDLQGMGWL